MRPLGWLRKLLRNNRSKRSRKINILKVLSGEIEPSKGEVSIEKGARLSVLKQDHFAYEDYTVIDTVIMGNKELYNIMKEKDQYIANQTSQKKTE